MTTAITRNGNGILPAASTPLGDLERIAVLFAESGYFKDARQMAQCFVKIQYGAEHGIGPATAMMSVHIIEGKPAPSATLMAGMIKRTGRYNYRVRTWTDKECSIEFFEQGESVGFGTFTLADAQKAGVANKDVWTRYGKAMLYSRAMSQGARAFCPDVFGGPIYSAEELGEAIVITETGEIIDGSSRGVSDETPPQAARSAPAAQHGPSAPARVGDTPKYPDREKALDGLIHHMEGLGLFQTGQAALARQFGGGVKFSELDDPAFDWVVDAVRAVTTESPEFAYARMRQELAADLRAIWPTDTETPLSDLINRAFAQCDTVQLGTTAKTALEGDWFIVAKWAQEQRAA